MCFYTLLCFFLIYSLGCLAERNSKCVSLTFKSTKDATEMAELTQQPVEYSCPRSFDPETFTKCCGNEDCCEPTLLVTVLDNDWLLMITAILVICSCLFLTALAVICCFWSKCPLYNTCRANYSTSNVITYSLSKEDPTPLMPAEDSKGGHYKPQPVKIKLMEDV